MFYLLFCLIQLKPDMTALTKKPQERRAEGPFSGNGPPSSSANVLGRIGHVPSTTAPLIDRQIFEVYMP
jgi:hypothetical protein